MRYLYLLLSLLWLVLPQSSDHFRSTANAQQAATLAGTPLPPSGGGGGGLVFTSTDSGNAAPGFAGSGSFTQDIGTASPDRIVMLAFGWDSSNTTMGTVLINGVTATPAIGNTGTNCPGACDGIWYANVTTGSGPQTISWTAGSGSYSSLTISTAYIHGQSGGGAATPTCSIYNTNQANPPPIGPLAITVAAGGVAFLAMSGNGASSLPTFTWTNTTSGSGDRTQFNATGNGNQLGTAHATASGNVTATSSSTMNFQTANLLGCVWAP